MKTLTNNRHNKTVIGSISAAALVCASLAMPIPASAGVIDTIKSRVDSIYSQIRSTRGKVYELVNSMNETKDSLKSGGAKQMLNAVRSTLEFLEESREQYEEFSGLNDCGADSPCDAYRDSLHNLIENASALPEDLPFLEKSASLVSRLGKASELIDKIPTFVLFASEQVIGDTIGNVEEMLGTLRSVAAEMPEIPTLNQLNTMDNKAFSAVCRTVSDNPHIALADVVLDNTAGLLGDLADGTQDNITFGITAVAGGTVSVKNPMKGTIQAIAFVVKTVKRRLNFSVALVNSACDVAG